MAYRTDVRRCKSCNAVGVALQCDRCVTAARAKVARVVGAGQTVGAQSVETHDPIKDWCPYPDPTPEMLETPEFEAVWQVIKRWDIGMNGARSGAMGNHVRAILDALTGVGSVFPRKVTVSLDLRAGDKSDDADREERARHSGRNWSHVIPCALLRKQLEEARAEVERLRANQLTREKAYEMVESDAVAAGAAEIHRYSDGRWFASDGVYRAESADYGSLRRALEALTALRGGT